MSTFALLTRMRTNLVTDDPQAFGVSLVQEVIEILHGTENWIDHAAA